MHPSRALDLVIAVDIMYAGMIEGWFRADSKGPHTLCRIFFRCNVRPLSRQGNHQRGQTHCADMVRRHHYR